MKKIVSFFAIALLFSGLFLTSCNSRSTLCPAYPPSVYHGDAGQQNIDSDSLRDVENSDI